MMGRVMKGQLSGGAGSQGLGSYRRGNPTARGGPRICLLGAVVGFALNGCSPSTGNPHAAGADGAVDGANTDGAIDATPDAPGSSVDSATEGGEVDGTVADSGREVDGSAADAGDASSDAADGGDASSDAGDGGDGAPPGCVATGSLTTPRAGAFVSTLDNGRVLVAGGWSGGHVVATAELYDPSTRTFSPTGSMAQSHGWSAARSAKLPDGRVLVAGGYNDATGAALATAELYDPASGTWSPTGSMASARENNSLVPLADGRVLVFGGWSAITALSPDHSEIAVSGAPTSSAEIYDETTGVWTPAGSAPGAVAYAAAELLKDGEVLVAAGSAGSVTAGSRSAELFSVASDGGDGGAFTAVGMLPAATIAYWGSSLFALPDGTALFVTASSNTASFAGGPLALFSPSANTFAPVGADLIAGTQGISLAGGDVFLLTGGTSGTATTQTEVYRASTGTWQHSGSMTVTHPSTRLALLNDGSVLVIGGRPGTGAAIATVDLCHP
jgi:Kelch motif